MPLDLKNYLHHLKDRDTPEEVKLKALEAIEALFRSSMDLERGIHSVRKGQDSFLREYLQSPAKIIDSNNRQLFRLFNITTVPTQERACEKFKN